MTEPVINLDEPLIIHDAAPRELSGAMAFERDIKAVSDAISYLKSYQPQDDDVVRTILALVQTKAHLEQMADVSRSEPVVEISDL
jgi:hypothetical protein